MLPSITDTRCVCWNCGWLGTAGQATPDVDGDGNLGCPTCNEVVTCQGDGSQDTLNATEALYGFVGWLFCREKTFVAGQETEPYEALDLLRSFIGTNGLSETRDGWHGRLIHPLEVKNHEEIARRFGWRA